MSARSLRRMVNRPLLGRGRTTRRRPRNTSGRTFRLVSTRSLSSSQTMTTRRSGRKIMAFGRRTEKVEDERGRHVTAVREREYVHEPTTHAARNEVDAEEQVTTATPSASSVA